MNEAGTVYVLRAFFEMREDGPVYGVFASLEAAQDAAVKGAYLIGEATGEWTDLVLPSAGHLDERLVLRSTLKLPGMRDSWYQVEEFQVGVLAKERYEDDIRRELEAEDEAERQREEAEERSWAESQRKEENWLRLSEDTLSAIKERYVTTDATQTSLAVEYDVPYEKMHRLLRGLKPNAAQRRRVATPV